MSTATNCRARALALALGALSAVAPLSAFAGDVLVEGYVLSLTPESAGLGPLAGTETVSGAALALSYELGPAYPGMRAWTGVYETTRASDQLSGNLQLDWSQDLFMLGVDLGREYKGFLRPSVRLGAGYALQQLRVETTGAPYYDAAHGFGGLVALGLEAILPFRTGADAAQKGAFRRDYTLGLATHFGYLGQTTAEFDELRQSDYDLPENDPWDRSTLRLGEVDPSGLFWNLGVVFRWRD